MNLATAAAAAAVALQGVLCVKIGPPMHNLATYLLLELLQQPICFGPAQVAGLFIMLLYDMASCNCFSTGCQQCRLDHNQTVIPTI